MSYWKLLTPMEPELSTGIVSIKLGDNAPENIKELLWEHHRLLVAYWHPLRLLRLSVAFFTTRAELEQALDAICGYVA